MGWIEIVEIVCKKVLSALAKVAVFVVWIITTCIEILLRELNLSLKKYLFPNRK